MTVCPEYRRSTRRYATVREMKEGPSRSAMFADRENVETRRIGKLRCRKDLRQALLRADRIARLRLRHKVAERVEPQLECRIHRIAASLPIA